VRKLGPVNKLQATAQATFARGRPTPGMSEPDVSLKPPESGKPGKTASPGEPWLGDVVEMSSAKTAFAGS